MQCRLPYRFDDPKMIARKTTSSSLSRHILAVTAFLAAACPCCISRRVFAYLWKSAEQIIILYIMEVKETYVLPECRVVELSLESLVCIAVSQYDKWQEEDV